MVKFMGTSGWSVGELERQRYSIRQRMFTLIVGQIIGFREVARGLDENLRVLN